MNAESLQAMRAGVGPWKAVPRCVTVALLCLQQDLSEIREVLGIPSATHSPSESGKHVKPLSLSSTSFSASHRVPKVAESAPTTATHTPSAHDDEVADLLRKCQELQGINETVTVLLPSPSPSPSPRIPLEARVSDSSSPEGCPTLSHKWERARRAPTPPSAPSIRKAAPAKAASHQNEPLPPQPLDLSPPRLKGQGGTLHPVLNPPTHPTRKASLPQRAAGNNASHFHAKLDKASSGLLRPLRPPLIGGAAGGGSGGMGAAHLREPHGDRSPPPRASPERHSQSPGGKEMHCTPPHIEHPRRSHSNHSNHSRPSPPPEVSDRRSKSLPTSLPRSLSPPGAHRAPNNTVDPVVPLLRMQQYLKKQRVGDVGPPVSWASSWSWSSDYLHTKPSQTVLPAAVDEDDDEDLPM